MNQENNNKTDNLTNPKEEKDLLARDEIKTMEKDTSRLREIEARRERERVAQIKTVEEIAREEARQEQARRASFERDLAEKEAKDREERVKRLREEREIKEGVMAEEKIEEKTARTEEFKSALKETQMREEEERKRFLARVEAKAEGREQTAAPSPFPPIAPELKEEISSEISPEIPKTTLKKPSFSQKLWIRIVLSLLVIALLAVIATFFYWYFAVREKPAQETIPAAEEAELLIPPALFYVEDSQTIKISQTSEIPSLLAQVLKGSIEQDSISRILIEDTKNNKILELKDFLGAFTTSTPEGFYEKLANDFTLFAYSQEEGNRLGLAVKISDHDGFSELLAAWEGTMENDLSKLFELLGKDSPALAPSFKDAKYQEANFRFQTFSRQDLGIVYAVYNDYFILTTSWESAKKASDRLKETPLSIFFSPNHGAEFVLENMDLQEKIGQLFLIGINGTTLTPQTEELIKDVRPGGILLLKKNINNASQTQKLIQDLQQVALVSYGIPLLIGVDQEGGTICSVSFGQEKTPQSEIKNPEQAYNIGLSRGEELKDLGINLNLAPVLDSAQPGDFLFSRVFQNTQELGALVKALILGQKEASILTAIKHFPGYGDIAFDPEDKLAVLEKTPEISLFKQAAEAQPEFVMTSNVIYSEIDPDFPFSFSKAGIALLKESVGPEALVITDDLPQLSLIDKFSLKGVVTLPIQAGADVLTFSNNLETTLEEAVRLLQEAVQNEEIAEARINESVLKIIKLKRAYYHYE